MLKRFSIGSLAKKAPVLLGLLLSAGVCKAEGIDRPLRPPAVPLIAVNPNFSIWSEADHLTDDVTRHWTHHDNSLLSMIRIDGKAFRLMGTEPKSVPALEQVRVDVLPTRSIYQFEGSGVHVTLTFTTPAISSDLEVFARPVTYLMWNVQSTDGATHDVSVFFSASSELVVNNINDRAIADRENIDGLLTLKTGSAAQTILRPAGDDTRVNWGYLYVSTPTHGAKGAIGKESLIAGSFAEQGTLPATDDGKPAGNVKTERTALGVALDFGKVAATPVSRHVITAYDEIYAIKFLSQKLRPYWSRKGMTAAQLLTISEKEFADISKRCETFDIDMMADLQKVGGNRYASISALAYRQAIAGCGLAADSNGQPLLFTKENTSNGCIATVDVIFPAVPQFLYMGPTYAKALVAPAMIYSTSPKWKFPFAPHDLGVYPQANAQVYGGGEDSKNEPDMMPVEESGNLIILCDAIARLEGNPDFAGKYWAQLTVWEKYLEKFGLDPENQLCTDDFMGHLAHNSNLSIKAILAIACYGDLCAMRGDKESAAKFMALAREDAKHWMESAADGDHYRIAFDRPNTWSQKYNLVWDKLLGLNIFPDEVAKKEVTYYRKVMQKYGVPLDSRPKNKLTKTDWSVWSATLADNEEDFQAIISPIYDYLNDTTARSPFVDSYETNNARSDGMHARPVIGGVFIKMLSNPDAYKKWAGMDKFKTGEYGAVPTPTVMTEVIPTSQKQGIEWKYTTGKPAKDWTATSFDDSKWKTGKGGFGSNGTPGAVIGTEWRNDDIWLRREITMPENFDASKLQLNIYHDEDVEVYFDGVLALTEPGYENLYTAYEILPDALKVLKPGAKITMAVHCHQTTGGQGIDVGIGQVVEQKK